MGTLQDDINLMGIFEKCRGVCETETHQVLKWWKTLMEMCAHVGVGSTPQPKHCYVWIQSTLAALNIATVGYLCLIFKFTVQIQEDIETYEDQSYLSAKFIHKQK